jgi:hypothetical protein
LEREKEKVDSKLAKESINKRNGDNSGTLYT